MAGFSFRQIIRRFRSLPRMGNTAAIPYETSSSIEPPASDPCRSSVMVADPTHGCFLKNSWTLSEKCVSEAGIAEFHPRL